MTCIWCKCGVETKSREQPVIVVQEGARKRDVRVNGNSEVSLRREGYCSGVRKV